MAKKVKLGDILQVLTAEGVAYAQVTHKHPEFGFLIRVFPGFHASPPETFASVVEAEPQFSAFFVVQSAVNQGLLAVVGNVPVSPALQAFPTFRARAGGPGGSLWLWDGEDETRLERGLSEEEMRYPVRGIISAPLLVERIEKGYRAHTHEIW
ncbi:hypothetical protein [Pseudomonas fontis]|uniref:Uncharacterized protein n=1 Tax=Pseudomonas fontis TaxID=2942633 RepID=A0ABT5NV24_9PSED|nr:hypothetical protein [Pseudomonas fontis]MDD0976808.1 hypothetical protein [Pseudomonas fontis]MDD0991968.1 hypothetical protein [Pseudomonas fontis]